MKDRIISMMDPKNPWIDRIQYFPSITSTNDVLKQLAQDGALHGTVLIAGEQTGGRGRLGRNFYSPPDVGIYMSALLRPSCSVDQLMHLTCAAACAACEAIEKAAGFCPEIKWTNDIVYQRRKLAGILTEMRLGKNRDLEYAIIGIGINCRQQLDDFSQDIRSFAGSLSMATGKEIDRASVAAAMIDAFAKMDSGLIQNKEHYLNQYREKCVTLGQYVSVVNAETVRHGQALDIDQDGALIVRFDDGSVETVNSGEVSVRGLYHYI